MIECPACGREHLPGTLFCENCGVYLRTGGPLGTKPLDSLRSPTARAESEAVEAVGEMELYLQIVGTDHQVPLPSTGEFLIGRLDAAQGIFPDLDLTPYGGQEEGVSREHCKIYRQKTEYWIQDLGSANGSLLNRNRLEPHTPYPIEAGDELQLGKLTLRILTQDQIVNGV